MEGVLCRKSQTTFYSHFSVFTKNERPRYYKVGDCIPLKVNRRVAVMLAEIIELSVDDDCESSDDDGGGGEGSREMVKIRLYAYPQDTPNGRNHSHGEVSN